MCSEEGEVDLGEGLTESPLPKHHLKSSSQQNPPSISQSIKKKQNNGSNEITLKPQEATYTRTTVNHQKPQMEKNNLIRSFIEIEIIRQNRIKKDDRKRPI